MILAAAILLFGIALHQTASQPAATTPSATAQQTQDQSGAAASQTPPTQAKPSAAPADKQATAEHPASKAKKRTHKKKPDASGCDSTTTSTNSRTAASTPPASAGGATPAPVAANCPPTKVIVPHGGASDTSIQLAGGPVGDQASQKRQAAKQMLGSTEENLKKITGLQLSEAQQDTVKQIRQFMDQSKAALADGDLERGHTLAWKAQLLSEDLVKPQQ